MLSAVHHAHAAAADPLLDPVAGDDRTEARVVAVVRHHAPEYGRPRRDAAACWPGTTAPRSSRAAVRGRLGGRRRGRLHGRSGGRRRGRRAADPPEAVVAVGGNVEALRQRLDPLALDTGPEVVAVEELVDAGGAFDAVGARAAARAGRAPGAAGAPDRARGGGRRAGGGAAAPRPGGARSTTLHRLALAAEYRDDNTHEHTQRVGELAARLARHLGPRGPHGVADPRRPRRCTTSARSRSPTPSCSSRASSRARSSRSSRPTPCSARACWPAASRPAAGGRAGRPLAPRALGRHRLPRRPGAATTIPIEGRLVHVADVFDVLVHERPYKESWTVEAAAEEIRRGAGTQFDPEVVRAFEALGAGAWQADAGKGCRRRTGRGEGRPAAPTASVDRLRRYAQRQVRGRCTIASKLRLTTKGAPMESATRVLVVANKTAATPALLDAVRERAAQGTVRVHAAGPQHRRTGCTRSSIPRISRRTRPRRRSSSRCRCSRRPRAGRSTP